VSKAINPQQSLSSAADTSRETGVQAAAASLNALLVPMAHIGGRIVPIYGMRPTAHNPNSSAYVQVDGWNVPFYPTHGLWRDDDESALNGASAGAFIGPVMEQFGPSYTVVVSGHLRHPSALASGETVEPLPLTGLSEWNDLSSTVTESESLLPGIVTRRNARPDPGDVLEVHSIAERYSDVGLYNLTCRDCPGVDSIAAIFSPIAVQTGETGAKATSTSSHIITDFTIGDVGTQAARARFYLGSVLAHGINSDDADTSSTSSTGYTVIPGVIPYEQIYGGGNARYGQMLEQSALDLLHADRTCYGNRFQVLLSHARKETTDQTEPTAAFRSDSSSNWSIAALAYFRLPDVLPGSENRTSAGSGSTAATRGALNARVIIRNAQVKIGIRKVTIAGSYGQASTFGSWTISTATHSSASWQGKDLEILFPSGIAPGDDYEIGIWWRSSGASTGYFRAWTVWEPPLTSVAP
jgi:hypothetical protein